MLVAGVFRAPAWTARGGTLPLAATRGAGLAVRIGTRPLSTPGCHASRLDLVCCDGSRHTWLAAILAADAVAGVFVAPINGTRTSTEG